MFGYAMALCVLSKRIEVPLALGANLKYLAEC